MTLLNKIKPQIDAHEIISFDIFDTLLLRPYVKPTDLFLHMEKVYDAKDFAEIRVKAEQTARKTHSDKEDITLDDIYDEISSEYKDFKQKEMDFEEQVLQPNPQMKEVYDYAKKKNKRIIITSDMYLPNKFLETVLKNKGFDGFEKLYVSGNLGKTKSKGSIYNFILKSLNATNSKIIHIGDNYHSDFCVPKKAGISSYYYEQIISNYLRINEKAKILLEKHPKNIEASILIMNFAYHWMKNKNKDYFCKIGYEYGGPMCHAYMCWIEEYVKKNGIEDILFIARDGYTLKKVFDGFEVNHINTHYVYAPRQVYQNCNIDEAISQKTVLAALRYYQTINEKIKKESSYINTESEAIKFIQNNYSTFKKLEAIERKNYKSYIDSLDIKGKKILLIDTVTGNVSSQQLISKNLPDKKITGIYWFMLGNSLKYKNQYDMKAWNSSTSNACIKCWDFIEYMMTSPEPPIKNIKRNKVFYTEKINTDEKIREKIYPDISENICAFSKQIRKIKNFSFSQDLIIEWINLLFTNPTKEDKLYLGKINIAYDASHTQTRPLYSAWNVIKSNDEKIFILGIPIAKLSVEKTLLYLPDIYEIKKRIKLFGLSILKIKSSQNDLKIYICGVKIFSYKNNKKHIKINLFRIPLFKLQKNYETKKQISSTVLNIENIHNNMHNLRKELEKVKEDIFYTSFRNEPTHKKIDSEKEAVAVCSVVLANMDLVFNNISLQNYLNVSKEPTYCFLWGGLYNNNTNETIRYAKLKNLPVFIWENGFLRSAANWGTEAELGKYTHAVSFVIDKVPYYDATQENNLERMLNDIHLHITEEQRKRARKCINKIVKNHLTKYNHQPIYTPNIGRKNVKKVLVVDQSYNDMSIIKGWGSEATFKKMLEVAIQENPDADIIIKTHPDTIAGQRGGYYTNIKEHGNIYTQTTPINPLSLIKYVDKVYVCSTQLGFEALMCNKEVHVFGMPFYAGWGLTKDYQKCTRRKNRRSLEEIFYIAYILYTTYVHPIKKCRCEIEDAMDYLLTLRDEFFKLKNIKNEL